MAVDPYDLAIAMGYSLLLIVLIIGCANLIYWFGKKRAMKRFEGNVPGWEDLLCRDTRSFLPGAGSGKNYGNINYVFPAEGKHHIEISGINAKSMDIEVKKPPVQ